MTDALGGGFVGNFIDDITGKTSEKAGNIAADQTRQGSQQSVQSQLVNAYLGAQQTLPQRVAAETILLGIDPEQTSAYQTQLQLYHQLPESIRVQQTQGIGGTGNAILPPTVPTGGIFDQYKKNGVQGILESLPGFKMGLQSQQRMVQNQGSAYGNLLSSQNLKNLNRSAQDYAGTQYGNLIQNAGGVNLASQLGGNLQNLGQGIGNTQYQAGTDIGSALAGGLLGRAQVSQGLLKTGSSIAGSMSGGAQGAGAMAAA